jgi:beta-glucosidase
MSRAKWVVMSIVLAMVGVARGQRAAAPAEVEKKVEKLLGQMTDEEKIQLLGGVDSFYTYPVERLGIPRLKMSDGPVGTRNDGKTTAYPAGVLLAATWDPAMAEWEGESLGRDARARGDNFLLGPGMNIYRVPMNGRNFEYLGEDPFLAGAMASGYVKGVQSMEVAATAKHFMGNNQEVERDTINDLIDERTLHEIYLPAFEAAVTGGHAWAVMAAYNRVNGDYMTANRYLQNDVLKETWKFDGVLMSDWGATHDALGAANGGLDLEMPSGKFLNEKNLRPLIATGAVSQVTIDDKIRRLLRVIVSMHWMDRAQKDASIPLDDPTSDATALAVAREGIVLLKNEGNLLPLDRSKAMTIALVGPNAAHYAVGGGSSFAQPMHPVTILDGLKAVGGGNVKFVQIPFVSYGGKDLGDFATASTYEGELKAEFFNSDDLTGPAIARTDKVVHFDWDDKEEPIAGITGRTFSARWTGKIRPSEDGTYVFAVNSDDGSRVLLDGKVIINNWSDHGPRTRDARVDLKAGEGHDLVVEYYNAWGSASVDFGWGKPSVLLTAEDEKTVAGADAVVCCVGTDESEGDDRPYALPEIQEQLIESASKINSKTIVILNAGGNVAMKDWVDGTPVLLDAFYPGQAGGRAIGEIVFGDVNPSGRLPDTFEKDWADAPAFGNYPGKDGVVNYAEGIYVGYRWFDTKKIEPRFCFGAGLSYTSFSMDQLKIEKTGSNSYGVTVRVSNTGKREGATVAQVYVRPKDAPVDRPFQELKGFSRVELGAGEIKTVTIPLDRRAMAYWDVENHRWKVAAGEYEIAVGFSSREIVGSGTVSLR